MSIFSCTKSDCTNKIAHPHGVFREWETNILLRFYFHLKWCLYLTHCFYFNHLPRIFLYMYFAFRITDWTCFHGPHLHAILRIINRGVSGLALILLAAFGAVDEPLASCMIVHFSAHISKWELVCKFGVIFHIFIIISCLASRFHAWN